MDNLQEKQTGKNCNNIKERRPKWSLWSYFFVIVILFVCFWKHLSPEWTCPLLTVWRGKISLQKSCLLLFLPFGKHLTVFLQYQHYYLNIIDKKKHNKNKYNMEHYSSPSSSWSSCRHPISLLQWVWKRQHRLVTWWWSRYPLPQYGYVLSLLPSISWNK